MASISQDLQDLLGVAGGYLNGGISVEVKTNYTPAITVYSGSGSSSASPGSSSSSSGNLLSRLVGLEAGVRVLSSDGHELASYGQWPATDWVRVAIALSLIGLLGIGLVKLVRAI